MKGLRKEGLHHVHTKEEALDLPINAADFAFPAALERNPRMELAMAHRTTKPESKKHDVVHFEVKNSAAHRDVVR